MASVLQVRDLYLHYADPAGTVKAVDGVSFELGEPGTALGFVGESGCGKSSAANAMLRMLPGNTARYEGEVWLDDVCVSALDAEEFRRTVRWRRMALVPQGAQNSLNPVMRVGKWLTEPVRQSRSADIAPDALERQARGLLERVGLPAGAWNLYPHELSGGMKQRVMIAGALIFSPRLLIMDEPTSALDVSVQAQIMNLLKDLKAEGLSILFITHDIALASDICDRLAVVYAGRIAEIGSSEQILEQPAHPYTRRLLGSIPRLHDEALPEFIPGAPPDLRRLPGGCRFHPRCDVPLTVCPERVPVRLKAESGQDVWCWLHDRTVNQVPLEVNSE